MGEIKNLYLLIGAVFVGIAIHIYMTFSNVDGYSSFVESMWKFVDVLIENWVGYLF